MASTPRIAPRCGGALGPTSGDESVACPYVACPSGNDEAPEQRPTGKQHARHGPGHGVAEPASKGAHNREDGGGQRVCMTGVVRTRRTVGITAVCDNDRNRGGARCDWGKRAT
jgi:hypothetical protein